MDATTSVTTVHGTEATPADAASHYTVVTSRRIKAGSEAEFESAMHAFVAYAVQCPGHEAISILRPAAGQRDYTVVSQFVSAEARAQFKSTEAYKLWMNQLCKLTEGDPQIIERSVLDGWLKPPSPAAVVIPPRYKTATATFLGVFMTAIVLNVTIGRAMDSWPLVCRVAAFNGAMVVLLAWVVMPVISAGLRPWLYPATANT